MAPAALSRRRNRVRAREPRGLTSDSPRVRVDDTGGWREQGMSEPRTISVDINGFPARVWQQGEGPKLGFLAGFGGLPRWIPFLDALARERTVIVPSLPGFPGGDRGHTVLDSHLDWVLAVRQLLQKVGLDGADLAGGSVGGSFVAEIAAIWPQSVRRLALVAPWGLFDDKEPPTDPWAQRPPEVPALLCADPERWNELKAAPEGANSPEWPIEQTRAAEAAARAFWPLGNTRLEKRLPLIEAPTLLIWGEQDRIMPRSYADRFAAAITGRTEIVTIPGAGHLAELDKPDEVAAAILRWTG
jgi:pimeloyl-ACP methyl ester carboxylesterase